MIESELEAGIEAICAELDVWRFHVPDSRRMRRGLPDDILIGTHGVLWRECKSELATVSRPQRLVAVRLVRADQSWDIWRPSDLKSGRIARELSKIAGY